MINEGHDLIDILELEKREIDYKYDRLIYDIDKLQNKNSDLQEELEYLTGKIEEAIEYIKSYLPNYDFDHSNLEELLEILGDKYGEN